MLGHKILVACIGNICRSPAAEGFIADYFKKNNISGEVASAGIHALVGESAAPYTEKTMKTLYGIDVSHHRAQQLTEAIIKKYDVVFAMSDGQVRHLKKTYPHASGKICLLGKWQETDIGDPYRESEAVFQECIALIQVCTNDWLTRFWGKI